METLNTIVQIISMAVRMTVPIAYVTLGAVIIEKSGISAIAMEGMMLAGAFGAVFGSYISNNAWIGLLFGVCSGMLVAAIRGFFCINLRSNQTVNGFGLNMLVAGFTMLITKLIWNSEGKSNTVAQLKNWSIPFVKNIPVLGEFLGEQSPVIYLFPIIAILAWFFLNRTTTGLHIITSGEHPAVLASLGISVYRTRYTACLVAGGLAGMGGAYLSICNLSFFSNNMTSGRGFMALAACIFGQWTIGGGILGSLLFGIAMAVQVRLQSRTQYTQFIQMIPYLTTILVLLFFNKKRSSAPAEGGRPYIEQEE